MTKNYFLHYWGTFFLAVILTFLLPGDIQAAVAPGKAAIQLPPGAAAGWWPAAQEEIRRSEYEVTWREQTYLPDVDACYQAPNRAHNLRTYFTPVGIQVIPRNSEKPEWTWGLSLRGYGFKGDIRPVAQARLSVSGDRIEYHREGLTEWYVNDSRGLEQGFTLLAPPRAYKSNQDSWVVLEMSLYGNLKARLNKKADGVELITNKEKNCKLQQSSCL